MLMTDAHDAPLLPRQMRAITDGFATSGVQEGYVAGNVPS